MKKDNQILTCQECGKQDRTVAYRACAYHADVKNDPEAFETVCDACEHEHIMDI